LTTRINSVVSAKPKTAKWNGIPVKTTVGTLKNDEVLPHIKFPRKDEETFDFASEFFSHSVVFAGIRRGEGSESDVDLSMSKCEITEEKLLNFLEGVTSIETSGQWTKRPRNDTLKSYLDQYCDLKDFVVTESNWSDIADKHGWMSCMFHYDLRSITPPGPPPPFGNVNLSVADTAAPSESDLGVHLYKSARGDFAPTIPSTKCCTTLKAEVCRLTFSTVSLGWERQVGS
jgi:hypothetical protein